MRLPENDEKRNRMALAIGLVALVAALAALSVPVLALSSGGSAGAGVAAALAMAEPTPEPTAEPTATPEATPAPKPAATPVPTPEPKPTEMKAGSKGGDVEKLQERLLELNYYLSDETMGEYGAKTQVAVSEFQRQNGLEQTGEADPETCALLFSEKAVKCIEFAELAPTVNMNFEELAGDDGLRDYPKGYPAADKYEIIVDIEHQVVMVYTRDADGEYTVPVRYMLCSTGTGSRTPRGVFKMGAYRVRFSRFKSDGRYGQYWTQINGAIYFHTFLYTSDDASAYDGDTYAELGSKTSHGCVRLTAPDARWIWYNIAYGTRCEIRQGNPDDEATGMIRGQLVLAALPEERATLVKGEPTSTDNWSINDIDIELPYKKGSQKS